MYGAIHEAKAKNDRIDSEKTAVLLRGGLMPHAYVYPAEMRATRDLMRRRLHFVRQRGSLLAHIQMTHHQYNLDSPGQRITYRSDREGLGEGFADVSVRGSIAADLALINHYEGAVLRQARVHDPNAFRLRSPRGHCAESDSAVAACGTSARNCDTPHSTPDHTRCILAASL